MCHFAVIEDDSYPHFEKKTIENVDKGREKEEAYGKLAGGLEIGYNLLTVCRILFLFGYFDWF